MIGTCHEEEIKNNCITSRELKRIIADIWKTFYFNVCMLTD